MQRYLVLRIVGLCLVVAGLSMILSVSSLSHLLLQKILILSPSAIFYNDWLHNEYIMRLYMFNCTNKVEKISRYYTPEFEELGPYVYRHIIEKRNVVWNDNHTVTYEQFRTWYFDPEVSSGPLSDLITSLNMISLSASYVSRYWTRFTTIPLSAALNALEKSLWHTKNVGELSFEGFEDPMLKIVQMFPALASLELPDRNGILLDFNATSSMDGVNNIDTGAEDFTKLGSVLNWKYMNYSNQADAACNEIKGSTGEFFPAGLQRNMSVFVFFSLICRTLEFHYVEDTTRHGISVYRYTLSNKLYETGYSDCGDECIPGGTLNVSACKYGSPAFVSNPHFMDGDPYYFDTVKGMKPDRDRHTFELYIEPTTGALVQGNARLQLNILLKNNPELSMFKNVPDIMWPLAWVELEGHLPGNLQTLVKLFLMFPTVALYVSIVMIAVGFFMLLFSLSHHINSIFCHVIQAKKMWATSKGKTEILHETPLRTVDDYKMKCPEESSLLCEKNVASIK